MRRTLISLAAACSLVLAGGVATAEPVAVPLVPAPNPSVTSANVTHVGTIPLDGVGVSMRVVKVGKQVRAFVSNAAGLSIYDATNPAAPLLLGKLAMYNWENEDIAVSDDGKTAILTEFTDSFYVHVVDVSNPNLPTITGSLTDDGSHTAYCADRTCNYLYGSNGVTYDIRNRAKPKRAPADKWWGSQVGAGRGGHALHRDAAGIWIADTMPLIVFKQAPDPLRLQVLTRGTITANTGYQHNNIRPRADKYRPRPAGDSFTGPLRPGELLLGQGETGVTQLDATCNNNSGAFSTWSMVGFEQGYPMEQLDVLRPFAGDYTSNGNPRVSGLACSGHWFTQKDAKDGSILITAAWYEHGTRFIKVDPKTGKIRQVGFYQPVRGSTSAAYWMPGADGDYVWSIDYHSGIDILTFDQSKAALSPAQAQASWTQLGRVDAFSSLVRQLCRQNGEATPAQRRELDSVLRNHHS